MIKVKNWSSYQSYKDRRPPWIRFHRTILDDYDYQLMSADARALLPMLWLLACEHKDPTSGLIKLEYKKIAFRLRMDLKILNSSINELQVADFIECAETNEFKSLDSIGFVYFLLNESDNTMKIGFSTQVSWRQGRIEREVGNKLKLLLTILGDTNLEKLLHEKFKHLSTEKNEWFQYVTDLEDYVTTSLRDSNLSVTPETETETETETEENDRFNEFWNLYNKKTGLKKCKAKWKRLKKSDIELIFKCLPAYISATPDKQYRKHPYTWLTGESWNDEIVIKSDGGLNWNSTGWSRDNE